MGGSEIVSRYELADSQGSLTAHQYPYNQSMYKNTGPRLCKMIESWENQLAEIRERREGVEVQLSDTDVMRDQKKYAELNRNHRELEERIAGFERYGQVRLKLEQARELLKDADPDMAELARTEVEAMEQELGLAEQALRLLLIPHDPNDARNTILEIRAGTGGDEAALFAGDLFRLYCRYAEIRQWKIEMLSANESDLGGFREVIFLISGEEVYRRLKYEGGIHRVQRVPSTETQGRIHTSAVTVAVMPEADEVDVDIRNEELKIDVYRSSGPGGQSVNTTDSAVRITHLPTNLIVTCQDEKSQHKNKAKALKVLRSRLLDQARQSAHDEQSATRRAQVGSGDRSGRIRTYNFPQNRLSDHRINLTLYSLEQIMGGNLDLVVDPLNEYYQAGQLRNI
jgi:peptide chain release factor 1